MPVYRNKNESGIAIENLRIKYNITYCSCQGHMHFVMEGVGGGVCQWPLRTG